MARRIAALGAAAALLFGCASAALLQRPEQDCINPSVEKVNQFNFFPEDTRSIIAEPTPAMPGAQVTDAADFDIKYYKTYKIVHVKRFNKRYVLYQCGTPDPTTLPAGAADGVKPGMQSFEVPLYSAAVTDTTVNGFLSELNLIDRVAMASPFSVGSCFQRLVDTKSQDGCKLVTPSPYFNSSDPDAEAAYKEARAFMADSSDAVFVGFTATDPKDILFPVTADPGPLNRAEWVKFVAAFFNKEMDANSVYAGIKGTYNALRKLVETKWASPGDAKKPVVAWVTTNSSGVSFRLDPYKMTLIKDGGGVPLERSQLEGAGVYGSNSQYGTQYVFVPRGDVGAVARLLGGADMLIDETYYVGIPDLDAIAKSLGFGRLADAQKAVPAFETGNVYRWDGEQSPTGSSGWLEMAVARPDWVLMDLARAFTPAVLQDVLNVTNNIANKGPAGTDFNYLLQVGDPDERGRPRVTAAKLCTTIPSCKDRTAFAVCPNVYRDCKTGKLLQADPTQRCNSWSVCDPLTFSGGRSGGGGSSGGGGGGGSNVKKGASSSAGARACGAGAALLAGSAAVAAAALLA